MEFAVPEGAMEVSTADDSARQGMLQDAIFPAFGNDAGNTPSVESPEEMQKNDPLGTQIWKLYSRAKTQLPNAERMENLMAMNMRRAELDRNKGYGCRHSLLLRYPRTFIEPLLTLFSGAGLARTARRAARAN
jgi:GATA-binding protein